MKKKTKDSSRYDLEYPSCISPSTRLWVSQEGDLLRHDGKVYRIEQIVRPKIRGAKPILVLLQSEVQHDESWKIPF